MKKNNNKLFLLLIVLISACNIVDKRSDTAVLLYDANIIDVETGLLSKSKAILIDSGRIISVGNKEELQKFVLSNNQRNLEGKYVMPGLWDSHVHIDKLADDMDHAKEMLSLYTLNGVTSIREMGGDWNKLKEFKQHCEQTHYAPSSYTAGPIFENKAYIDWIVEIDNDPSFRKLRIGLETPDQVPPLLDSVVNLGVDIIKIRTAPSPEVFFKLAEECKKHGIKLCGHVDAQIDLYEAVESGISSLEHLDIFQVNGMSESMMDSIAVLMKQLNTSYCPTLTYFKKHRIYDRGPIKEFLYDSTSNTHPMRLYASKSLLRKSQGAYRGAEGSPIPWTEMEPNFLKFADKLVKNEVLIIAGTDGANALVLPGFSLHEELILYKTEFGMSNLHIIQTATINPAKYFGFKDQGLIQEGYTADLVVLDQNPMENIKNIKSIHAVVKNGEIISKEERKQRLDQIRKLNMAQ